MSLQLAGMYSNTFICDNIINYIPDGETQPTTDVPDIFNLKNYTPTLDYFYNYLKTLQLKRNVHTFAGVGREIKGGAQALRKWDVYHRDGIDKERFHLVDGKYVSLETNKLIDYLSRTKNFHIQPFPYNVSKQGQNVRMDFNNIIIEFTSPNGVNIYYKNTSTIAFVSQYTTCISDIGMVLMYDENAFVVLDATATARFIYFEKINSNQTLAVAFVSNSCRAYLVMNSTTKVIEGYNKIYTAMANTLPLTLTNIPFVFNFSGERIISRIKMHLDRDVVTLNLVRMLDLDGGGCAISTTVNRDITALPSFYFEVSR